MGFIAGVLVVLFAGPFVWKALFPEVHSMSKVFFVVLLIIGGVAGVFAEQWLRKNKILK
jgi:F0F1-type ATP synthase assembly protein I